MELRADGIVVDNVDGVVMPGCRELQRGGTPPVTIEGPPDDDAYATLGDCLRWIRDHYPEDAHIQLRVTDEGATVGDYVRAFRVLHGAPGAPLFERIY